MNTDTQKLARIFLIIIVVLFLNSVAYASSIGVINASDVNVRTHPDTTKSNIVNCVAKNYIVRIIENSGEWYKIKYSETEEGWVSSQYVDVIEGIGTGIVKANSLNFRQQPDFNGKIIGSLDNGQSITILDSNDVWYKVKISSGAIGWVSMDYVDATIFDDSSQDYGVGPIGVGIVSGDVVNVRQQPGLDKTVLFSVDQGDAVNVYSKSGDWYEIETTDGKKGWIYGVFISVRATVSSRGSVLAAAQARKSVRDRVVEAAKKFIGVKYVWGGNGPKQFDCSGFSKYVMAMFGVNLNRVAEDQARQGKHVSKSSLKPGDLVFFHTEGARSSREHISHVGIYIGNGDFIHASSGGKKVIISDITSGYYSKTYVTGRNVLD